jgi:hypothetical protein
MNHGDAGKGRHQKFIRDASVELGWGTREKMNTFVQMSGLDGGRFYGESVY